MKLENKIIEYMTKNRLSQRKTAIIVGISFPRLNNLLNGTRKQKLRHITMFKLKNSIGVDMDTLLEYNNRIEKEKKNATINK